MELEMAAGKAADEIYEYEWRQDDRIKILTQPIIRSIASDVISGVKVPVISARFHHTLIRLFSDLCGKLRRSHGLNRVVLSGGVFQNAILLTGLHQALEQKNFEVYTHKLVPTNDGGISLGQAVVAAAKAVQ
jgi:hydrogenase maturation protein HypF